MSKAAGVIKSFDVDFAHCECSGTRNKSDVVVVSVKWKRKPCGKTRFQCNRCKSTWSMDDVALQDGRVVLDAGHPAERARRKSVHPNFNEVVAVNVKNSAGYFNREHV